MAKSKSKASKVGKASKASKASKVGKSKKTKVSKSKKSVQQAAPAPTPAPAPALVVVETAAPEVVVPTIEDDFQNIAERFTQLRALTTELMRDVKRLHKRSIRQLKEAERNSRKRRRKRGPNDPKRKPSGFAKPSPISDELCDFLGKTRGTEMARTEVTKFLTQYIKNNNLQDQQNRRRILCDSALANLLSVGPDDEVTYFNLQKYMKPHFFKAGATSAST